MRVLVCALVVAACADGGVMIEVNPGDPTVDQVRVYLGVGSATENATLTTATMGPIEGVTYWTRDASNELDHATITSGDPTTFFFRPLRKRALAAVIAVGYAQGVPVTAAPLFDLVFPTNEVHLYKLKLEPVNTPTAAQSLDLWGITRGTAPTEAACVGLAGSHRYPKAFIVSHEDPDCDGLLTGAAEECVSDVFLGSRPPDDDALTCLVTAGAFCHLGGAGCTDDTPSGATACTPGPICAPMGLCTACGSSLDCARDIMASSIPAVPHIECAVPYKPDLTPCVSELHVTGLPTGGLDCIDASIANRQQTGSNIVVDGLQLAPQADPSCRVRIATSGTTAGLPFGALLQVELVNGKSLALPVAIKPQLASPCGEQVSFCTMSTTWPVDAEDMMSCAAGWQSPSLVAELDIQMRDHDDPTLTADMLEIMFNAGTTLWSSKRASATDPWPTPVQVEFGSLFTTLGTPELDRDGQGFFFAAEDFMSNALLDVYRVARAGGNLSPPARVAELSGPGNDYAPTVDASGDHAVFGSNLSTQNYDLYSAMRSSPGGMFGPFTSLGPVNSTALDGNPQLSDDGRSLYFSSARSGNEDMYFSMRAQPFLGFSEPIRIKELSTPSADTDPWVSPDGRTMYFASDRNGYLQIFKVKR